MMVCYILSIADWKGEMGIHTSICNVECFTGKRKFKQWPCKTKGGTNAIYGVDGSPVVHDMFFVQENSENWHTILMVPMEEVVMDLQF